MVASNNEARTIGRATYRNSMKSTSRKMKTYASFSDWRKDQSPRNKRLINALVRLVDTTDPSLTKIVKWGQGCWVKDGAPKIFIHAEPDHVQLGFYAGASFNDPDRLLAGRGKYVRFVKVHAASEINERAFIDFIEQATK